MAETERTLKITITINKDAAIRDVQAVKDALAGISGLGSQIAGGRAGGSRRSTTQQTREEGNAAEKAASQFEEFEKALEAIAATGSPAAARAARALSRALGESIPLGEEATKTLGQVQRAVKSALRTTEAAGAGDRTIVASFVKAEQRRLGTLVKSVDDTVFEVRNRLKTISGKPDAGLMAAFNAQGRSSGKAGADLIQQYKTLIDLKRRFAEADPTVSREDITRQAQTVATALRTFESSVGTLRSMGAAVETSARSSEAAGRTMRQAIDSLALASSSRKQQFKRDTEAIGIYVKELDVMIAGIGSKAAPEIKAKFDLLKQEAINALKEVERTYKNLNDAQVRLASGKGTQAQVDFASAEHVRAVGNLNTALRSLEQGGVELRRSATAAELLRLQLRDLEKQSETTKRGFVNMGLGIKRQIAAVNQFVAQRAPAAKEVRAAFQNAGKDALMTLSEVQSARERAFDTKALYLQGKASGREVAAAFEDYHATLRRLGGSMRDLNVTSEQVRTSSARLAATLSQNQQRLDEARRTAYAFSIAGYQLQATLGIVTKTMQGAVSSFAEFDFVARRAAGALGIFDQTGAAFDSLGRSIENTAVATKLFDPKTIAQGYYYWGSTTGQVVQSQEDLLRIEKQVIPVMQAAAITQTNLETAMKGVYAVISEFGMPVEDAAKVTNKLFLVSQKTAAEIPDLIDSFKMVGPVAAQLGVSFDDVVGMLGALSNAGVKGGMAGRALRQTFIKLTDPTVRASKALDDAAAAAYGVGTSFEDIVFPEGQFVGMQGYLDALTRMTENLTQQEKARLLGVITTNNEVGALTQLVNANTAARSKNTAGVIENARATYSDAEAMRVTAGAVENQMQSAQATFGELSNVAQSTLLELGRNIWEMVRPMVRAAVEAGKFFLNLIQNNPIVAKLAAGMLLLTGSLVALVSTLLIAAGAMKLFVALMEFKFIPSLVVAPGRLGAFGKAVILLAQRIGILNATMDASGTITSIERVGRGIPSISAGFQQMATAVGKFARSGTGIASIVASLVVIPTAMELWNRHQSELTKNFGIFVKAFELFAAETAKDFADIIDFTAYLTGSFLGAIGDVGSNIVDWAAGVLETIGATAQLEKKVNDVNAAVGGPQSSTPGQVLTNPNKLPTVDEYGITIPESTLALMRKQIATEAANTAQVMARATADRADEMAAILADRLRTSIQVALERSSQAINLTKFLNKAFKTGKAEDAKAAIDRADNYLKSLVSRFEERSAPAAKGLTDGIRKLLESTSSNSNKLGTVMSGVLEKGFLTGDMTKVSVGLQRFIQTVQGQISSAKPNLRRSGATAMADLLSGFTEMDFSSDPEAAVMLQRALTLLALPGAEAAGSDVAIAFLKQIGFVVSHSMGMVAVGARGRQRVDPLTALLDDIVKIPTDTATGQQQQSPLEKALDVARQGADLAENLQKVAGRDIKAMVKQSMTKIAEAVVLADKLTYEATKSFSKSRLQAVADFSDNSSKVMSLISSALDAFGKMSGFKKVPKQAFTDLKFNVISAVASIVAASKSFKDDRVLARAIVFADDVEKVMGAIGAALDSFAKMGEGYEPPTSDAWKNLTADIAAAVTAMGNASKKVSKDLVPLAKNFSEDISNALTVMGSAVDLFVKLQDIGTYTRSDKSLWTELTADIAAAVDALGRASKTVQGKFITAAKDFAEKIGGAIDVIGKAVDLFDKLPGLEMPDGAVFGQISSQIALMATALGEAAGTVDRTLLNAAKAFAQKVGPVVSVIGEAVGALNSVATFVVPDKDQITAVVISIRTVMESLATEIDPKKFKPTTLTSISNFSKSSVDALNAVKTANEVFAPVVEDLVEMGTKMIHQPPTISQSVKWIVDLMTTISTEAVKFPKGVTESVSRMAKAAGEVVSSVKSLFDIMAPQDLSTAGQSNMSDNIRRSIEIALNVIKSALAPFVDGFKITGRNIVDSLTSGINDGLPALRKAVAEMKSIVAGAVGSGVAGAAAAASGRTKAQIQEDINYVKGRIAIYEAIPSAQRTQHQNDLLKSNQQKLKDLMAEYDAAPFAKGGRFRAGQMMLVGEKGPELIRPSFGGQVIPNHQIGSVVSDGQTIRLEHVIKGDVSNMTAAQVAALLNSSMGSLATAINTSAKR